MLLIQLIIFIKVKKKKRNLENNNNTPDYLVLFFEFYSIKISKKHYLLRLYINVLHF
jgi:hypothetical protein